ncbi:uncharacterized protein LOC143023172 [Oratosquilla oratoria]|uniref:uncharacterized protein LOC143023172 n=1 Tax=Oratosquilla oratoria TaxID=337810 RepID=UPI003F76ABF5
MLSTPKSTDESASTEQVELQSGSHSKGISESNNSTSAILASSAQSDTQIADHNAEVDSLSPNQTSNFVIESVTSLEKSHFNETNSLNVPSFLEHKITSSGGSLSVLPNGVVRKRRGRPRKGEVVVRKKPGRPSKVPENIPLVKRKRGRPKGSKSKPKVCKMMVTPDIHLGHAMENGGSSLWESVNAAIGSSNNIQNGNGVSENLSSMYQYSREDQESKPSASQHQNSAQSRYNAPPHDILHPVEQLCPPDVLHPSECGSPDVHCMLSNGGEASSLQREQHLMYMEVMSMKLEAYKAMKRACDLQAMFWENKLQCTQETSGETTEEPVLECKFEVSSHG